jgi:hypothetical protein
MQYKEENLYKNIRKLVGITLASAVVISALFAGTPPKAAAKKDSSETKTTSKETSDTSDDVFDPNGVYHARLGIQSSTYLWVMNLHYYNGDANELFGTDLENSLICAAHDEDEDPDGDGLIEKAGDFVDAEIAGNGTYTVELNNADFAGDTAVSQLHVATDIPVNDQVKFTDVKAVVNGNTFMEFDEGFMEDESPYLTAGEVVLIINSWRDQLVKYIQEHGHLQNGTGYELLSGNGDDTISITFTVSGFAYDKAEDTIDSTDTASSDAGTASSEKRQDRHINYGIPIAVGVVVVVFSILLLYTKGRKSRVNL